MTSFGGYRVRRGTKGAHTHLPVAGSGRGTGGAAGRGLLVLAMAAGGRSRRAADGGGGGRWTGLAALVSWRMGTAGVEEEGSGLAGLRMHRIGGGWRCGIAGNVSQDIEHGEREWADMRLGDGWGRAGGLARENLRVLGVRLMRVSGWKASNKDLRKFCFR